jgi:hypothetical protein
LAVAVTAAVCTSALAIGPALASSHPASHGHGRGHGHGPRHGPSMNISFASGPNSNAHWLPRQRAVEFRVGADTGGTPPPEYAEIVVHHFPAAPPALAPSFAVTGPGTPYLDIGFTNGGHLQGTAGDASTAWSAYDSTATALVTGTDYATALAAEQGTGPALVVNRVTLIDAQAPQGAAYTDVITALQYNGVSLVPRGHKHG